MKYLNITEGKCLINGKIFTSCVSELEDLRLSGWQYSPNFDYQNPVFPFFKRNWQADPKSKTKCKASKIAKVILKNKNKAEGLTLLNTIIH